MKDTRFFGLGWEKTRLLAAVLLTMFLSSLDQTIVSTAMPTIVRQLGGLEIFSWVFTAYMVTSTIAVMLSGKLGDMRGRKNVYFWGIVTFIAGSVFAGFSGDMIALILSRAFQGIGGGIIMANSMAIISDIFPPAERGKWQGLIGAVFATSSVVGPLAGALITENFGWHWIFFVNLPLGVFTLYLLAGAKQMQPAVHGHKLDIRGAFWFTAFVGASISYLVSGLGSSEPAYLLLLAASAIALFMFLREESSAKEPVLPLKLFSRRIFAAGVSAAFISSVGLFGVVTFLPLLVEEVFGRGVSEAGAVLTPLMLAMVAASTASGMMISRTGRYRLLGIAATAVSCAGLFLLSDFQALGYESLIYAVVLVGAGAGALMPLIIISVQNAFEYSQLGTVTSAISFSRVFGGVLGVSVMGAMINLHMGAGEVASAEGFRNAFTLASLVSLPAIVLMFYMEELPLRRTHQKPSLALEVAAELVEDEAILDKESAEKIREIGD